MKNVKFSDGDVEKIGLLAVQIKMILLANGIMSTNVNTIAALRLINRISEVIVDSSLEENLKRLQSAMVDEKELNELIQELKFIMADMEAGN